jgi:hypothetical protein
MTPEQQVAINVALNILFAVTGGIVGYLLREHDDRESLKKESERRS